MSFNVIDIQPTPNPNAMKYVLDKPISDSPRSYFNAAAAAGDELAVRLFAIDGVTSLFLLNDFVTVNKRADVKWNAVTAAVKKVLSTPLPVLREGGRGEGRAAVDVTPPSALPPAPCTDRRHG